MTTLFLPVLSTGVPLGKQNMRRGKLISSGPRIPAAQVSSTLTSLPPDTLTRAEFRVARAVLMMTRWTPISGVLRRPASLPVISLLSLPITRELSYT